MKYLSKAEYSRRRFFGQMSCAGMGYLTFVNSILNLKGINAAAMANSEVSGADDYKAIVCVLLAGGNDSYNMLVPSDETHYNEYSNTRKNLALSQGSLLDLSYTEGVKTWGLHPSMPGVRTLFNTNRAAFISNVGTLLNKTTTKQNYDNGTNLPIGLFSHADQIQQWQTGIPNQRLAKGWAGKMADLIGDMNPNQNISMNISLSGSNIFQTGDNSVEYAIDPQGGAVGMNGYNPDTDWIVDSMRTTAIDSMLGQYYEDIFHKTYINVLKNSRDAFIEFNEAFQDAHNFAQGDFAANPVSEAFKTIAQTISVRQTLGFKRQVFFMTFGGWDHHDGLLANQAGMLGALSQGLFDFQNAMEILNTDDCVLTMTISDFARTLNPNSDGSDHAWGGNALVTGGPNLIQGGMIHGSYPSLAQGAANPLEVYLGRLIPTLSTDEYFGEIAQWFGVAPTDLSTIFPNINNMYTPSAGSYPIGFIKS